MQIHLQTCHIKQEKVLMSRCRLHRSLYFIYRQNTGEKKSPMTHRSVSVLIIKMMMIIKNDNNNNDDDKDDGGGKCSRGWGSS